MALWDRRGTKGERERGYVLRFAVIRAPPQFSSIEQAKDKCE